MNEPNRDRWLRNALVALLCVSASACSDALLDSSADGGTDDGSGEAPAKFVEIYETPTFQMCQDCHAPDAAGATAGTETTQDWSSSSAAYTSLKGKAAGLIGNFAGCNGVSFVGATGNTSLLVAVLDANVRASFSDPNHPGCKAAAITDETLRVGSVPSNVLQDLKAFIDGGGFR
jgi:hypothetical protein